MSKKKKICPSMIIKNKLFFDIAQYNLITVLFKIAFALTNTSEMF